MTDTIDIPSAADPRWDAVLSGAVRPAYKCLALRILMIRLTHAYARDDADRPALVEELRRFFRDNLRFAREDYATIFQGKPQ
ncbi:MULTISPECIES: hypothetical protein [Sphingomonas]|jgi:hypothetical protein|uniref:Uncharacterized protein n=1 Tax=Sphingomonas hankookensis TaxID=563996 RepID=A0ABR5Y9A7_9SPHN|nr:MULTISPECIES: hypothetical protein [Sphingomonas]KZE08607.1 hypothetical protein AVT10_08620 [Sphingomonas hankookensis]PZT92752.1 MAG: hypothetical protein DI625_11605 [Sphingomonas sp.]RSV31889.1 hypothetical protein CA237_05495 [Sphingomonas sp. ABOLH]WCP71365.1 hypothetical protein PPZ50_13530 [Sphingomonas hankookensis]